MRIVGSAAPACCQGGGGGKREERREKKRTVDAPLRSGEAMRVPAATAQASPFAPAVCRSWRARHRNGLGEGVRPSAERESD